MKVPEFYCRLLLFLLSAAGYCLVAYDIPRHEFLYLMAVFAALFGLYLAGALRFTNINFKEVFASALLLRMIFLFAVPALSDDYFRFIWDGTLTVKGFNPFVHIPEEFIRSGPGQDPYLKFLAEHMNSPGYYSVYPPVLQWVFATAALLGGDHLITALVALRVFILVFEAGTLLLMRRLLKRLHLPVSSIMWYAWNPLVIVELSGNLHFEALMIFFLLLACWWLIRFQKTGALSGRAQILISAAAYAFSVATKLIPLMFLPLVVRHAGLKNGLIYCCVIVAVLALLFLPFYDLQQIQNMWSSLDLYFRTFEFNASVYYLIREAGFRVRGYNIIDTAGPILAATVFIFIVLLAMLKPQKTPVQLLLSMQWALTIFLFFSTTVHPWYVTGLVTLHVFTGFRYGVAWSFAVLLSYAAYRNHNVQENLWYVALEYGVVTAVMVLEILLFRVRGQTKTPAFPVKDTYPPSSA